MKKRKDIEEMLMKLRGIIIAQLTAAKKVMGHKLP
jgi:hypothetical protein